MAIDFFEEDPLSLAEAARVLPRRRGKRIHLSTLYRWSQRGIRGVRLETGMFGGTRMTSREALERFFKRLDSDDSSASPASPTTARRKAQVERELDSQGL